MNSSPGICSSGGAPGHLAHSLGGFLSVSGSASRISNVSSCIMTAGLRITGLDVVWTIILSDAVCLGVNTHAASANIAGGWRFLIDNRITGIS